MKFILTGHSIVCWKMNCCYKNHNYDSIFTVFSKPLRNLNQNDITEKSPFFSIYQKQILIISCNQQKRAENMDGA